MLIACVCNPIFINTFVVFVRLYWFEKRFRTVVSEAQRLRRTRERSRTKSDAGDEERRLGIAEEKGVGDKKITVMRPGHEDSDGADRDRPITPSEKAGDTSSETDSSSRRAEDKATGEQAERRAEEMSPTANMPRAITFADEVPSVARRGTGVDRMPVPRSKDEHIAFVEKQKNRQEDNDTLYIPGPRDWDRGAVPKEIDEGLEDDITQARTMESFPSLKDGRRGSESNAQELNGDDHPLRTPERSATTTSDSAVIVNHARDRIVSRVKDHLPFRHQLSNAEPDAEEPRSRFNLPRQRTESPEGLRKRDRTRTFASFLSTSQTQTRDPMPYLSYQPTIGRNSAFVNLTEDQREELGGIEYRALKLLAAVLCCYFVGFHILGLLSYLPWIENSSAYYKGVLDSDGVNYGWWGVFTPASMFNDLGFTLTPDSMQSFNAATWILLMGSFLIIIGNTGFPCMLRFTIWVCSLMVPKTSALWEEFRFLLDHPRRCFTLLFPSNANWWLFWVLILLNGIDLIFFVILDLNGTPVSSLSGGLKVLDGLFQAASTRTAGFGVANIAQLHPAIQVSYLIMMYISVFPIAISVRRTNVYEEKSLGVYHESIVPDDDDGAKSQSYVGAHLRRQLSFDLWYVFLGLFIITIVEGDRIQNTNDWAFTIFAVLFEVVSAYGTVGLSLGYPNTDPSFSAQFHTLSKLVIIAMQIRGRHRGLPYALDKAVLLPSETLHAKEREDADRREEQRRRGSNAGIGLGRAPTGRFDQKNNGVDSTTQARDENDGASTAQGTSRVRGYSLGKLLSNALGAGPSVNRKMD